MKYSHNKKRNTAFIFEALIRELTKATLDEQKEKKQQIVDVLKKYFSKGSLLKQDLEIYKSLNEMNDLRAGLKEKVLAEAKKQFISLPRKKIFDQQSKIISEVNKLNQNIWNNFVVDYKKLATINQILVQTTAPKKQVVLEERFLSYDSNKDESQSSNKFPKVNNLAVNNFVDKFNEQYSEVLNENQKVLLSKYIKSSDEDVLEFKTYLYSEVGKIKSFLKENKGQYGEATSKKINNVLEKVDSYRQRKLDNNLVFDVFRIQSLVEELRKNGI